MRPEWLHVALGGSAQAVERLRVDDYMAYYRSARDRFLRDSGGRDAGDVPAGHDVPRSGRALRRLSLGGRMRRPSTSRRPSEPRRRDIGPPAPSTDRPRHRHPRSAWRPRPADGAAVGGRRRRRARPRPRTGAGSSSKGVERDDASTSCSSRRQAPRSRSTAALPRCPRPRPGDLFFDIEGDPYAFDDGLDYLFGTARHGRDVHTPSGRATTSDRVLARR